jgi:hypothetical protein
MVMTSTVSAAAAALRLLLVLILLAVTTTATTMTTKAANAQYGGTGGSVGTASQEQLQECEQLGIPRENCNDVTILAKRRLSAAQQAEAQQQPLSQNMTGGISTNNATLSSNPNATQARITELEQQDPAFAYYRNTTGDCWKNFGLNVTATEKASAPSTIECNMTYQTAFDDYCSAGPTFHAEKCEIVKTDMDTYRVIQDVSSFMSSLEYGDGTPYLGPDGTVNEPPPLIPPAGGNEVFEPQPEISQNSEGEWRTFDLFVRGNSYPIQYIITGGSVEDMTIHEENQTLGVTINSMSNGTLTLRLPGEVIDSKTAEGEDVDFAAFINNGEFELPGEIEPEAGSIRTILISFPPRTEQIDVLGTTTLAGDTGPP